MKTEFRIEFLSDEEKQKPKVLQVATAVRISLEGEMILADDVVAFLKTKYNLS